MGRISEKCLTTLSYMIIILRLCAGVAHYPNHFECSKPLVQEHFKCKSGVCIDTLRICDGRPDCPDESDESADQQCHKMFCDETVDFWCNVTHLCIDRDLVCNRIFDCVKGEDEVGCLLGDEDCPSDKFTCKSESRCIPEGWKCDGEIDCSDGSDELNCVNRTISCIASETQCNNLKCIPSSLVCDGVDDCDDGEDEKDCYKNCDLVNGYFACNDTKKCIDRTKLCDYSKDCDDGSDEGSECGLKCNMESCHNCQQTPLGPKCICDSGFHFENDTTEQVCKDIDECKDLHLVCDHFCKNKPGSFTCSCATGYSLLHDNASCRLIASKPAMLLFTVGTEVQAKMLDDTRSWVIDTGDYDTVGVAYDPVNELVYWTAHRIVFYKPLHSKEKSTIFIDQGLIAPENLAVDWLGKNLYISDNQLRHIVACGTVNYYCTIVLRDLKSPRALQLDIKNRLMYWTDIYTHVIERAGMDGSDRKIIFRSDDLHWPNGLALDLPASRLYWADARSDNVRSSNLLGGDVKDMPQTHMTHVFSLAVWEDRIYWTDWDETLKTYIHSSRKRDGHERTTNYKHPSHKISNLIIFQESMYNDELQSPCDNSYGKGCSHVCVVSPSVSEGYVCTCPEEMKLAPNKLTCIEKDSSKPLVALDSHLYFLELRKFGKNKLHSIKYNGQRLGLVADMSYDPLNKLVYIADSKIGAICSLNLRHNVLKTVVPYVKHPIGIAVDWMRKNIYWIELHIAGSVHIARTNGHHRKSILTDLRNPTSLTLDLSEGYLYVGDGSLNAAIYRCDLTGENCKILVSEVDIRDPISMSLDKYVNPKKLYWADSDRNRIESIDIDGSNRRLEFNFYENPMKVLIDNENLIWTLRNHKEIGIAEKINTTNSNHLDLDLKVNRDSNEWFPTLVRVGQEAKAEHFPCDGCLHFCFSKAVRICGCTDGFILANDSKSCVPKPCSDAEFQCSNGECIHNFFRCDSSPDCEDGSDEELCIVPCTSDQFNCSNKCIEKKEVCDGYIDCNDGSDEVNCTNICTSDLDWKCESGECIPRHWLCDGVVHCKDESSDEANCDTLTCLDTQLKCGNASKCVPSSWWCDKTEDCPDGEDERSCSCKLREYKCKDGQCVNEKQLCTGEIKCPDEDNPAINCTVLLPEVEISKKCPINYRPCATDVLTNVHCVPLSSWCDGTEDCLKGEDEKTCEKQCRHNEIMCSDGSSCILETWRCDEVRDCNDGSDENGCIVRKMGISSNSGYSSNDKYSNDDCETDEYLCPDIQRKCIPLHKLCDGHADCVFGYDESSNCDKCDDTNGGCDHLCYNSPGKPTCGCDTGFRLAADNKTCNDINECEEIPNLCHHICKNIKGSYRCLCNDGFSLKVDDVTCKSLKEADWNFVLADSDELIYLNEEMVPTNAIVLHTPLVNRSASFLYDRANKSFLAIDDEAGLVYRLINDSYTKEFSGLTFASTSAARNVSSTITASSFDYVNNNLYMAVLSSTVARFERTIHSTILKVCNIDKKICANLLPTNVRISSMVASPKMRTMYMCENPTRSDSGRDSNGRIVSRKLNGEGLDVLVDTKILQCTSISLDEHKERIYWIDGGRNRIESVDKLGHDRKVFTSNEVHHARELAVINNNILWFNADSRMVVKCYLHDPLNCPETYHGKDVSILDTKQVFDELIPTPCKSSHCPHICVPESREIPHCLCATGYVEKNQTCQSTYVQERINAGDSCDQNVCGFGLCQTISPGMIQCMCHAQYTGKHCEFKLPPPQQAMSAQAVAGISIFSLALIFIVIVVCVTKKESINHWRRSIWRRIRYSNSNFGLMNNEEDRSLPPTPPIPRYNVQFNKLKEGAASTDVAVNIEPMSLKSHEVELNQNSPFALL